MEVDTMSCDSAALCLSSSAAARNSIVNPSIVDAADLFITATNDRTAATGTPASGLCSKYFRKSLKMRLSPDVVAGDDDVAGEGDLDDTDILFLETRSPLNSALLSFNSVSPDC
jgi:hypothetical protein